MPCIHNSYRLMISVLIFMLHLLNTCTKFSLGIQKPTQIMGYVLHFTYSFLVSYETVPKICTNFTREVLHFPISQNTELYPLCNFSLRCGNRYQQIDAFALNSSFFPQKRCSRVSVLGERSLQIVWKALTCLTELQGNSFHFLKIRVWILPHCIYEAHQQALK